MVDPPTRGDAASTRVEAWLVSLAPLPPAEPPWWRALLDADEQDRADRFHRSDDRVRYVGRHVALRVVLAERLGVAPDALRFDRAPCPLCGELHGRPVLAGRDDVHFSLSSSGDAVAVAVAPVTVGIDVETVGRATADELAAALDPAEQAVVHGLAEPARSRAALRCWARKEALLKGRGTGLGIDPDAVHVGVGPLARAPRPDGWVLADLPVPRGLVAAVAYRSASVLDVDLRTLRLAAAAGDGDDVHELLRRTRAARTATH